MTTVLFIKYAYSILFLWVLLEQLGLPVPSIPILLTAGTLSATHRISDAYSLLVVLIACLIADSVWFFLGRRYGTSVIRLLCRLSFNSNTCVAKTENYFARRGPATLLFAKFVPGLSTVAPPIAGQTGMSYAASSSTTSPAPSSGPRPTSLPAASSETSPSASRHHSSPGSATSRSLSSSSW